MSNFSDFAGGKLKVWVSGTTYAVGKVVLSPANNYQPYVRVVAGAGATDPASDTTNWRPTGGRAIKSVQRGTLTMSSGSATGTATVTSVDTSKSELTFLGVTNGTASPWSNLAVPRLALTNATTITATRGFAVTETLTLSWELREFY